MTAAWFVCATAAAGGQGHGTASAVGSKLNQAQQWVVI
jgi:hypothetical protein